MIRLTTVVLLVCCSLEVTAAEQWIRHTIDDASRGADGVRLGDADQDGRVDIVTGWEEGGRIRICFQPEASVVKQRWPSIEIAAVKSPEDAVFADVNGDGWLDVVSCCEGKTQTIWLHLSPGKSVTDVRDPTKWKTAAIKESIDVTRWMFCEPLSDGSLVFGSKNPNARIVHYRHDKNSGSRFKLLRKCGWIMSIRKTDVDSDGDEDVIYSDRKGQHRGVGWLEQTSGGNWIDHKIGGGDFEVMFLDVARNELSPSDPASRFRGTARFQICCDTRNGCILRLTPRKDVTQPWLQEEIAHPTGIGGGKAVAFGDIDNDGRLDLACTCEHAAKLSGVYWLRRPDNRLPGRRAEEIREFRDISGQKEGVKFDRIELMDVDSDGDLDLITCEERDNLGVIWYENPLTPGK